MAQLTNEEQRKAEANLTKAFGQHTAYLYRLSSGASNEITGEAEKVALALWRSISEKLDELSDAEKVAFAGGKYPTDELKSLRDAINTATVELGAVVAAGFATGAAALAAYEAPWSMAAVSKITGTKPVQVSSERILRQALARPLAGGRLVSDMLDNIAPATKEKILFAIRAGISNDQSNSQIIRALRGTKALEYKDGIMQATKTEIERAVRTARNHISAEVYEDTYEKLGVKYYIRSAMLDGRTCKVCAPLDGKVYEAGKPRPPATMHYNCRCQYIPSMTKELMGERPFMRALKVAGGYKIDENGDRVNLPPEFRSVGRMTKAQRERAGLEQGRVKADVTFSKFFASQDEEFKRQWLGPNRYALYTKGKFSLDRFVDPQNKLYTLDELRLRDAETFKQVFGE